MPLAFNVRKAENCRLVTQPQVACKAAGAAIKNEWKNLKN